ncbi:MAG: AAA family ATPase [Planctomycetes bacterium]|nr:AAA family ATPase [Planctomycetota bacterium]
MKLYNEAVVKAADAAVRRAIKGALSSLSTRGAVVGIAPAGAGKSYAIGTAVLAAREKGLRVVVATPTNEQAYALVHDLAVRLGKRKDKVTFLPAVGRSLPAVHRHPKVVESKARDAGAATIRVGTLDKLGDAFARGDLRGADLLLIDEAYQANAVHYYKVAGIAKRHLLMGDSGQLAPFSTAPEADRWRGLAEDPLLRAVEVLDRNHPGTQKERLPITRRLDPRAVPVVSSFYPGHPFQAAVLPGVRDLTFRARRSRSWKVEDKLLEHAALSGWAHAELPESAVLVDDPAVANLLTRLAKRLLARGPVTVCERSRKKRKLTQSDIVVVVSHNDQKDRLRILLDEIGLPDVVVSTANKVQGLTFEVVLAWHPLAGLQEADEFHLDPGRMCVILTRHRHACIVVGREGDRKLVEGIPPPTPAYPGWDLDPALDGWYAHEGVFNTLSPHRIAVS